MPVATKSTNLYEPELKKMQREVYINIITGKLPIDAFDTFVADWYKNGGQTLIDEATEWYKNFKTK